MSAPYGKALEAIDAAHAEDPKKITKDGQEIPYELHYARKMSHYLDLRQPNASPVLRLAIRAQHLRRWEVPRDSYPLGKVGYYSWRTFLKKRQADIAQQICIDAGMSKEEAEGVAALIRKEDLKSNDETMILEDVACLVFLDDQFDDFKDEFDQDKIIAIVRKTWVKMTEKGHELALQIPMTEASKGIIGKALQS
ncbi:hypothetical protein BT63DRAFT_197889 [Microthyrium microscopicum]|uniref:Glutamyl-tRNA synthetase n=1 Tax=Microthyrium microscopicum TaxID=703497 RepID=A0A6A6UN63_9PEZI|nr:hypothetical protein BT63DRAFT_197889 [Microthyrium microscopicum]